MNQLLDDSLNVQLLRLVCAGEGAEFNISWLSQSLDRHRNTIASRLDKLIKHRIVDLPFHPFPHLFVEYPLLVIEKVNFPRDSKTNKWIEEDPYVWAAFFKKDEEYNTLMVELHRDLYTYQTWKERIIDEEKITLNEESDYYPSEAIYLDTRSIIKDDSSAPIHVLRQNFESNRHSRINDLQIDDLFLDLMEALLQGKGIWTNPNELARRLGVHRRTVQRRLDFLLENKIISKAVCRFPRIWTPPEYFIVLSLLEIRKHKHRVHEAFYQDPHVSMMAKANAGRYNLLMLTSFYRMQDHLSWAEEYDQRFPASIGAVRNLYLSPAMTFSIQQQYVTLTFLDHKLQILRGEKLISDMESH